ncbi:unnamed protein product [Vitrella brassicaformis CCMP3155]|uniref:Apple domain-containing protein n=1 Tax=Vitrella brassicaformis (strain CCMP3155) TaxID=1169540 RepID=A0A0G4GJ92_VITBC|nr:unnamed protein product [Vitrella brassicaformis CCMP3155]|eukprot:CEM29828.1 unnamed protein product [Vitrella brassicaformis CCMP3155]
MHPRPGALHVSELTSIAVREGDLVIPTDLDTLFDVEGRQSGKVDGRVVLARDNKTVLFYPDKPFVPGDNVTVQLRPGLRVRRSDNGREEEAGGHEWQFHIRGKTESISEEEIWSLMYGRQLNESEQEADKKPSPMDRYRTLPTWSAKWRPSAEGEKAALEGRKADIGTGDEELYFFGVRGRAGESLIATRQGDLVWWTSEGKLGGGMFGVTPNGHLAHWDQLLNDTADTVYLLNATYQVVDRYVMGHGYQVDRHSITFDNDNSVVTAYTRINALNRTIHTVVQVQDADKNVLMEWRTVDDFRGGADPMLPDAPWDGGDVYHTNNAERTPDGNVIVSVHNANLLVLLSGKTGQILWRMGGHTSDFTFIGEDMDPPFVGQHHAQQLADGNILMYDNGSRSGMRAGRPSRALELSLDLNKMTATKVWSFPHPNKKTSTCCGGVQKVDNGEGNPPTMLIGWGSTGPFFTEVTYDDNPTIIREFEGFRGHRPLLHSWEGFSTERPRLLLCSDANTQASGGQPSIARLQDWTMHFSFNGVTGISKWRLYIGADSDVPLSRHLMERSKTAFEEIVTLQELVDTMAARNMTLTTKSDANVTDVALYVRVVPVKGDSELLRPSKALKVPLVVSSRDEESGAVSVSPPLSAVPCRCYQPDIGLREHLGRPKPERESPVVDMAAIRECAGACADSDKCKTFFFFEDTGECEMDEKKHESHQELHSLGGVVSGLSACVQEELA